VRGHYPVVLFGSLEDFFLFSAFFLLFCKIQTKSKSQHHPADIY